MVLFFIWPRISICCHHRNLPRCLRVGAAVDRRHRDVARQAIEAHELHAHVYGVEVVGKAPGVGPRAVYAGRVRRVGATVVPNLLVTLKTIKMITSESKSAAKQNATTNTQLEIFKTAVCAAFWGQMPSGAQE